MSNDEYQQKQFFEESYMKTIERLFKDKILQDSEKWFSYTHDLIMDNLKNITNEITRNK
jgi:hypothetical protein